MIRKIVRDLEKLTRAEAIAEFALLKGWTVCGFSNDAFDPGGDKDRVIVSIPKPDAAVESHCAFVGRMKDYINRPIIHFVFHPKACAIEYCTTVEEVTGKHVPRKMVPRRVGDPPALVANPAKAQALLQWKATRGLRDVVATAWKWMERQ